MEKATFLTEEQIWGDNKIDIFKKIEPGAAVTDFSILLGAYVSEICINNSSNLEDRMGYYWTASSDGDGDVRVVHWNGDRTWKCTHNRDVAARPALLSSSNLNITPNGVRGNIGIAEIEYGEYPQTAVEKQRAEFLERLYCSRQLVETGKKYTTDSRKYTEYNSPFSPQQFIEYQYNNKKYIRVKANSFFDGEKFTLSNGEKYQDGDNVWVEVQPIKWYFDDKTNIMIAEKCLFAGVRFDKKRGSYKGNFSNTLINNFLEKHFIKDIKKEEILVESITKEDKPNRKRNMYNFQLDDVSEEDIIRGAVESAVPVFLHGRSSEGKSARVKQLDPDCKIIYLKNATPDSINGKSVYNSTTDEMIDVPPTWLKKINEKCKNEPDKIHILFFDEITNALPSIQGMVYNIILDREVNDTWKLPDNCRIVAAGNEVDDSLAANQIAEPLFNRFAHVYIKTEVDKWLQWAVGTDEDVERLNYKQTEVKSRIHPSICAYIAYRGEKALRSEYTGDKPNADPRKWELASKMLYKTNNPHMLRALVGEDITMDFTYFCNQEVITIDDVLNNNYSTKDLEMDPCQMYATVAGLSSVDEANLETIRKFTLNFGNEFVSMFDSLWIHGDDKRTERIAELRDENQFEGGRKL